MCLTCANDALYVQSDTKVNVQSAYVFLYTLLSLILLHLIIIHLYLCLKSEQAESPI